MATDRVANLLLAYKGRSSFMASSRAAEDIARQMAREVLVGYTASARVFVPVRPLFRVTRHRLCRLQSWHVVQMRNL